MPHTATPFRRASSSLDNPPYQINIQGRRAPLHTATAPASCRHADGTPQYHAHNLYALSEGKATYEALAAQTQKRPFLLSRCGVGVGRPPGAAGACRCSGAVERPQDC